MEKKEIVLVLAHGFLGWGEDGAVSQRKRERAYFYGVENFLRMEYGGRAGLELSIVAPTVPAAQSVEQRGKVLMQSIDSELEKRSKKTRAHILAHSMGGLDARWVIVQEGMAGKIASLTTIATPHRGTTIGNWAYQELSPATMIVRGLFELDEVRESIRRQLPILKETPSDQLEFYNHLLRNYMHASKDQLEQALHALTLEGSARFNEAQAPLEAAVRARTQDRVAYFAYGGRMMPGQTRVLVPTREIIEHFGTKEETRACGSENRPCNDGAVSIWSAHYPWDDSGADYVRTLPFDHFMQINWRIPDRRPDDALEERLKILYREIIEKILSVG